MTTKLITLLTNFEVLVKDWKMRQITAEPEFLRKIRDIVDELDEELENQELLEPEEEEEEKIEEEDCDHEWIPLLKQELLDKGYGSSAAQIGYACEKCGKQKVLWPEGAYWNKSEQGLRKQNKRVCQ